VRDAPLRGERLPALRRAAVDRDDFDAGDLLERFHVDRAHRAGSCETDFHRRRIISRQRGVYSSINRVGFVTAMVRTSSAVNPPSSSRCANIANPSATGGLIVWPRSVEIRARDTPASRMLANADS